MGGQPDDVGDGDADGEGEGGLRLWQLLQEVQFCHPPCGVGASGGRVFRALWHGSTVAVKLLVSDDVDTLQLSTREALLSRLVSHPHLVQAYCVCVTQLRSEDLNPQAHERRWQQLLQALDGPMGLLGAPSTYPCTLPSTYTCTSERPTTGNTATVGNAPAAAYPATTFAAAVAAAATLGGASPAGYSHTTRQPAEVAAVSVDTVQLMLQQQQQQQPVVPWGPGGAVRSLYGVWPGTGSPGQMGSTPCSAAAASCPTVGPGGGGAAVGASHRYCTSPATPRELLMGCVSGGGGVAVYALHGTAAYSSGYSSATSAAAAAAAAAASHRAAGSTSAAHGGGAQGTHLPAAGRLPAFSKAVFRSHRGLLGSLRRGGVGGGSATAAAGGGFGSGGTSGLSVVSTAGTSLRSLLMQSREAAWSASGNGNGGGGGGRNGAAGRCAGGGGGGSAIRPHTGKGHSRRSLLSPSLSDGGSRGSQGMASAAADSAAVPVSACGGGGRRGVEGEGGGGGGRRGVDDEDEGGGGAAATSCDAVSGPLPVANADADADVCFMLPPLPQAALMDSTPRSSMCLTNRSTPGRSITGADASRAGGGGGARGAAEVTPAAAADVALARGCPQWACHPPSLSPWRQAGGGGGGDAATAAAGLLGVAWQEVPLPVRAKPDPGACVPTTAAPAHAHALEQHQQLQQQLPGHGVLQQGQRELPQQQHPQAPFLPRPAQEPHGSIAQQQQQQGHRLSQLHSGPGIWVRGSGAGGIGSSTAASQLRRASTAGLGAGLGFGRPTTESLDGLLVGSMEEVNRMLDELYSMGAAPGKYLTAVLMEYCEHGTLLDVLQAQHPPQQRRRLAVGRSLMPRINATANRYQQQHQTAQQQQQQQRPGPAAGWPGGGGGGGGESHASPTWQTYDILVNALEIAQGMAYLHSLNLVHGDLKPANVLIKGCDGGGDGIGGRRYICKISDFGLTNPVATTSRGVSRHKQHSSHWGALSYLAPEVPAGRCGKPSDVYSFGALLWHMAVGLPPHHHLHPAQLLVGLVSGDLTLEWPPGVDPTIRRIGQACMAREPKQRPTFEAIVRTLLTAVRRAARKHRAAAAAAAAAANRSSGPPQAPGPGPGPGPGAWPTGNPQAQAHAQGMSMAMAMAMGGFMVWEPPRAGANASTSGVAAEARELDGHRGGGGGGGWTERPLPTVSLVLS